MSPINIVSFERLPEPPMNPGADQTWWEAEVTADNANAFHRVWVYVAGARTGVSDDWARAELEKLGEKHGLGKLYSYQPFELRP